MRHNLEVRDAAPPKKGLTYRKGKRESSVD